MNDPKSTSAQEPESPLAPAVATGSEDWWTGWRLDEPAGSVVPSVDGGADDWWAGWHAALLRDG